MKILQISPQFPYPLDDGGRKGIWGISKSLFERGNEITFIAYQKNLNNDFEDKSFNIYRKLVLVEAQLENSLLGVLINLFSSVPYNISKYKTKKFKTLLINALLYDKPDVIHIDHLHMVWTGDIIRKIYPDVPIILREHNIESNIMKRFSAKQKNYIIKVYSFIQYKKLVKYEAKWCGKVDCCMMISSEDEKEILQLNPDVKTCIIPAGINIDKIGSEKNKPKIKNSICHIGPMDWYPNYDSLNWFLYSIFPEILSQKPEITLYIFGKGTEKVKIPEKIRNNVTVVGFVNDLWKEVSQMQLVIVPLRIGGGIRIKILETMAAGINILSTTIGKEGIPVNDQEHILIADSEKDFSEKIIRYFNSEFEDSKMIDESIQLIKREFTWNSVGEKFENEYLKFIKIRNFHS